MNHRSITKSEATQLLGSVDHPLVLRMAGPQTQERTLSISSQKVSVGSAEACTLQLPGEGIEPLTCLIVRGRRGAVVRNFSSRALLNGERFEESRLAAGDRLSVGQMSLEVVDGGPTPPPVAPVETALPKETPESRQEDKAAERRVRRTLRRRAKALVHELRLVRAESDRLRSEVGAKEERIRALDGRLDKLDQQLSNARRVAATQEAHRDAKVKASIAQLQAKVEENRRQAEEVLGLLGDETARGEKYRDQVEELRQQLADQETEFDRRAEQLVADLEQARQEADYEAESAKGLQRQLRAQRERHEAAQAELGQRIAELEQAKEQAAAAQRALQQQQGEHESRERELKEQLQELQAELESRPVEQDLQTLAGLREELNEARREIRRREDALAHFADELKEEQRLRQQAEAHDSAATEQSIAQLRAKLEETQRELAEADSRVAQLETELQHAHDRSVAAEAQIQRLEARATDDLTVQNVALRDQRQRLEEEARRLQGLQAKLLQREQTIENQLAQLAVERQRLEGEKNHLGDVGRRHEAEARRLQTLRAELLERERTIENQRTQQAVSQESLHRQREQLEDAKRQTAGIQRDALERSRQLDNQAAQLGVQRQIASRQRDDIRTESRRLQAQQRDTLRRRQQLDNQFAQLDLQRSEFEWQRAEFESRGRDKRDSVSPQTVAEQQELDRRREELDSERQELVTLRHELDQQRTQLAAAEEARLTADEQLNSTREELDARRERLDAAAEQLEQKQAEIERRAAELEQRLADVEDRERQLAAQPAGATSRENPEATQPAHATPPASEVRPDFAEEQATHDSGEPEDPFASPVLSGLLRRDESEEPSQDAEQADEPMEVSSETPADDQDSAVSAADVLARMGLPSPLEEGPHESTPPPRNERPEADADDQTADVEPAASDSPDGDSDESIEDYMARLMQRVRGEAAAPPLKHRSPAREPAEVHADKDQDDGHEPAPQPSERPQPEARDAALSDFKPRTVPPELSSNLRAMRELANQSARTAIGKHTQRRWASAAVGKLLVAIVGIIASGLLLSWADIQQQNVTFFGALAALVVATFWALQSAVLVVQVIKARRRTEAAEAKENDQESAAHDTRPSEAATAVDTVEEPSADAAAS